MEKEGTDSASVHRTRKNVCDWGTNSLDKGNRTSLEVRPIRPRLNMHGHLSKLSERKSPTDKKANKNQKQLRAERSNHYVQLISGSVEE